MNIISNNLGKIMKKTNNSSLFSSIVTGFDDAQIVDYFSQSKDVEIIVNFPKSELVVIEKWIKYPYINSFYTLNQYLAYRIIKSIPDEIKKDMEEYVDLERFVHNFEKLLYTPLSQNVYQYFDYLNENSVNINEVLENIIGQGKSFHLNFMVKSFNKERTVDHCLQAIINEILIKYPTLVFTNDDLVNYFMTGGSMLNYEDDEADCNMVQSEDYYKKGSAKKLAYLDK